MIHAGLRVCFGEVVFGSKPDSGLTEETSRSSSRATKIRV